VYDSYYIRILLCINPDVIGIVYNFWISKKLSTIFCFRIFLTSENHFLEIEENHISKIPFRELRRGVAAPQSLPHLFPQSLDEFLQRGDFSSEFVLDIRVAVPEGEFHDQADAKWIVITGLSGSHNPRLACQPLVG
jgi:hypothetical protein